jgi:Outer membrane protein beta-barrel domain
MSRLSRGVFLTAVLTAAAVVLATLPAAAQTREGLLLAGKTSVSAPGTSAFLTAGMVEQAPPPGGGGPRASGFGIGAKIGPLFTSYTDASNDNFKFKTSSGWEGGIWFGGNRGGRVGVMGEILYAKKKAESSSLLTGSATATYLEIPILLRINIGSRSRNGISIYGLAGPVFDVNLSAKDANDLDIKDRYESLDLGVLFGAGIEITRFLVEGRYNQGLRNVLKDTNAASFDEIKTHSFALLFGIRFN